MAAASVAGFLEAVELDRLCVGIEESDRTPESRLNGTSCPSAKGEFRAPRDEDAEARNPPASRGATPSPDGVIWRRGLEATAFCACEAGQPPPAEGTGQLQEEPEVQPHPTCSPCVETSWLPQLGHMTFLAVLVQTILQFLSLARGYRLA